jgi:hypothetical protein
MKLAYWISQDLDDSCRVEELLHIRSPSLKDCEEQAEACGGNHGKPRKVEVEYDDAFELVTQALNGLDLASFELDVAPDGRGA